MPNTFLQLDVPRTDGFGAPSDVRATGRPKSIVATGAIDGRYVVEGSNDAGATWDILVDRDGTEALFVSASSGTKNIETIVGSVRVRAVRPNQSAPPPAITLGAPPALGANFFGRLDVPDGPGLGAPLDLGTSVGPFKTFTLRGAVPDGALFTILASMDGVQFDEVLQFNADQQGARSDEVMCRFLRVSRSGIAGPPPIVSVGAEPAADALAGGGDGGGGTAASLLTMAFDPKRAATGNGEEVLYEYVVPFSLVPAARFAAKLCAFVTGSGGEGSVLFRVRVGGTPHAADGSEVTSIAVAGGESVGVTDGAPFTAPGDPVTLVKITALNAGAAMAGFFLAFRPVV